MTVAGHAGPCVRTEEGPRGATDWMEQLSGGEATKTVGSGLWLLGAGLLGRGQEPSVQPLGLAKLVATPWGNADGQLPVRG